MFHKQILCFIVFVCIYLWRISGVKQRHTDKNNDYLLLSKFLRLQSEYCGYVQLCTIKRKINATFTFKEQPCCRSCSCDERCVDAGTCCPDFWLRDAMDDAQFDSITELMNITEQKNITYIQNKTDVFSDTEQISDAATCVSSRMKSRSLYFEIVAAEAYVMISFCPRSYTNNEIKSACEDALLLKTPSKNKLIPVTSVDTKQTYRNMFCLSCHEGHDRQFVPWESWLTCSHRNVVQQFIERPDKLFQSVVLGYYAYCNIVYKPPSDVQVAINVCQQADVTSCPNISNRVTEDKSVIAVYDNMCRRYHLPVFVKEANTYTVYKNIACYLCNKNDTLPQVCLNSYPEYKEYELEINVMDMMLNETEQQRNSQSFLGDRYDLICNVGYIYDETSKICRHVLCPRHFYIYDGSCVPTVTHMHGVYFTIMLEVKPTVLITTTNHFHKQYEEAIEIYLTQKVRSIFSQIHTDIWRKTTNRTLHSNVVSLKFKSENDTYSDTIQKLRKLLENVSHLRNSTLNITASVSIADNVFERSHFRGLQNIFDRETGAELHPVSVSADLFWNEKEFEISKSHFCHRLELNESEISRMGKNGFRIVRTGVRVEGANFDITDGGRMLACVDVVLRKTENQHRNSTTTNIVTEVTNQMTVFIIFGVLLACVFFLVTGRLISSCMQRERND